MTSPAEAAAYLAEKFNPAASGIRREGRVFIVPSRTRPGLVHRVAYTLDGHLICDCEAASLGKRECWAVNLVREEIAMNEETSTALVPVQIAPPTALVPSAQTYSLIERAARLALSGAISLPRELNTPEKVAAVMLYGVELGLKPMTAIRHLFLVNGRVQPSAEVMAGMLLSREPDAKLIVKEVNDARCTMRIVRPSKRIDETLTVTWDDIVRAKLNKDVALLYPQDRMRWHCTKRILRIYAPEVINGLDMTLGSAPDMEPEEDEQIDNSDLYNDGDMVEGEVIEHEAPQQAEAPVAQAGHAEPKPAPAAASPAPEPPAPKAEQKTPAGAEAAAISSFWAATRMAKLAPADVTAQCKAKYDGREPMHLTPGERTAFLTELTTPQPEPVPAAVYETPEEHKKSAGHDNQTFDNWGNLQCADCNAPLKEPVAA